MLKYITWNEHKIVDIECHTTVQRKRTAVEVLSPIDALVAPLEEKRGQEYVGPSNDMHKGLNGVLDADASAAHDIGIVLMNGVRHGLMQS